VLGHVIAGHSWEAFVIEQLASAVGQNGSCWFYRTRAGAEIDFLIEWPNADLWAFEIKRASAPVLSRGFYSACADLRPIRRFVVYSGERSYPQSDGVEVVSVRDAMQHITRA
jgi:uncharacterized protein